MDTKNGSDETQNTCPLSNVSHGYPFRTPVDTTKVKFTKIIIDTREPDAMKVARPVRRGAEGKVL